MQISPPPLPAFRITSFVSVCTSSMLPLTRLKAQLTLPHRQTLSPKVALASAMSMPAIGSIGCSPSMPVSSRISYIGQMLPSVCLMQGIPRLCAYSTSFLTGGARNLSVCRRDTIGFSVIAQSPFIQRISAPISMQFLT